MNLINNKIIILIIIILLLILLLSLFCCHQVSNERDLYAYLDKVNRQAVVSIKPLPKFLSTAFEDKQITDYKEKYSVHALRLMGVMLNKRKRWGLILLPNNKLIKVKLGDLVGKERAQVKKITFTTIKLLINNKAFIMNIVKNKTC